MDQYNDQHPAAATVPRVTAAPATTATRWPCPTKAAPVAPAEHEEADDDAPATDTWSDHASDPDAAHAPVISPQPAVDPQPPATLLSDMADDHSPPRDMDLFHDPNLFDQYMYASKDDTDQNPAAANVLLTTAAPAEQEELLLPMTPTTPEREKVNEDMEHDFFFNWVWAVPPSPVAPAEQEALAPDVQAQPEVKQELHSCASSTVGANTGWHSVSVAGASSPAPSCAPALATPATVAPALAPVSCVAAPDDLEGDLVLASQEPVNIDAFLITDKEYNDQYLSAAKETLATTAPVKQESLFSPMTPTTPGRQQAPRVFDHFFSNSVGIGWKVESATPFERHISPEPEVLPPDAREMEQGHSGLRPFSHHLLDDFKIDAPDAPGDAASGSSTYSSLRGAPQHEPPAAEEVVRAPAPKRRLVAKNHDCEICAMRFPSASALARHVLTHTGVKPHACTWSECGKSFPSASALTQHVRVHTKEQPFACELPGCGKGFSQKINLKTHMDRHNGVTYRCDSCGKGGFTDTSNLSNHQTYRCGGEKKFPCEVCLVAFGSKFDLNRHKNTSKTHKEKVVEASKTHKRKAGEAFPSDA